MEAPLSTLESFSSKKRQNCVGSLTRKVIKAVQPGVRGKCLNRSWAKSVGVECLKTGTALSLVGGRATFSLEEFLPWTSMNLKNFNAGPRTEDYLITVKSWESFQVMSLHVISIWPRFDASKFICYDSSDNVSLHVSFSVPHH